MHKRRPCPVRTSLAIAGDADGRAGPVCQPNSARARSEMASAAGLRSFLSMVIA